MNCRTKPCSKNLKIKHIKGHWFWVALLSMLKVHVDSFGYQDQTILKDISFEVAPGEHVALMGESGSGKSTLLKIIYGLLHVEEGSIFGEILKLLGLTLIWFPVSDTWNIWRRILIWCLSYPLRKTLVSSFPFWAGNTSRTHKRTLGIDWNETVRKDQGKIPQRRSAATRSTRPRFGSRARNPAVGRTFWTYW